MRAARPQRSIVRAALAVLVALAVGASVMASVSGCTIGRRRTADDTVVMIVDLDFLDIDPRFTSNAVEGKLAGLVTAGLTTVDQSLEAHLFLAERIEEVDPLTRDVTLRADARFPDGTAVTADDVVYTWRTVMDPAMKSPARRSFEDRYTSVEKLDARRVRFVLKAPLATFMSDLAFGIVQKSAAEAQPGGRWKDGRTIGAGAYAVVKMKPGVVVLARNEHYAGVPPALPRVVIRTVKDPGARMIMLAGSSADLTQNGVRLDLADRLGAHPRLQLLTGPSVILTYLMFQNEDPILRDGRVRRAIAHALDRRRIVDGKFGGHAVLATGLLPPAHWAYTPDVARHDYDPDRARALLDEAGHPDPDGPGGRPRFTLVYKTSADPFRLSVARLIAQQLGDVGIAVDLRAFEFGTFFADVKAGNYQLASMQTTDIVEPDMHTVYFHTARIPTKEQPDLGNRWRYRSAKADALMEAGRRELDVGKRKAIYADLQRLLADDLPIMPLWHEDNVVIANRDVAGYVVLPDARLGGVARVTKAPR